MSIITWDNADFLWNNNSFTWDEVILVQQLVNGAGDDYTQWEDFEKKKLVKLILKVYGDTITETKQKEIKQYKIKASDIKITAEKVLGIELVTENIKF
tara:strand:+ start:186 stop:479 length:294 start_codon:yes stop_codon:yes gene_type:complete